MKKENIKKDNSHKNLLKNLLIILIIVILTIAITSIVYYKYKVVQVNYIPLNFKVGKVIGLTTDTDALHFGRIPRGSGGIRQINVTNDLEYDIKINLKYYSEDMDWVSFKDNGLILKPDENNLFSISVNVPINAIEKEYNATVKMIILRN
ncbi:MAG: hypothetical protein KAQ83_00720 [Nanoarchaeota archaeon]|nr:hypothetical protein [Nanoarchaeota archaeon]